jgi:hypothetical protein
VIEKSNRQDLQPATDSSLRPGDFILGSRKSRAAARALLEQRKRPKHPPGCTLDLSSESFDRCQEIYSRLAHRPYTAHVGSPYIAIRFPPGFVPTDTENTDRIGNENNLKKGSSK